MASHMKSMNTAKIGDRVHSENYGFGTITARQDGDYPMFTIILDGDGDFFAAGHMVHCDLDGVRNMWSTPDALVDFKLVEQSEDPFVT